MQFLSGKNWSRDLQDLIGTDHLDEKLIREIEKWPKSRGMEETKGGATDEVGDQPRNCGSL